VSSGFSLVVIAAISWWMLRENGRVLIAFATKLISEDVSGVRVLTLRRSVINKLAAAPSAGFFDARIFHRHLPGIRRARAVYIFSRPLGCICAFTDVRTADRAVVERSSTQVPNAVKTMILRIVTIGIDAARRSAHTLNRLRTSRLRSKYGWRDDCFVLLHTLLRNHHRGLSGINDLNHSSVRAHQFAAVIERRLVRDQDCRRAWRPRCRDHGNARHRRQRA